MHTPRGILRQMHWVSDKRQLLLTRYIDDWGYQANVRGIVNTQLRQMHGGFFNALNENRYYASQQCSELMQNFADKNLNTVNFDGGFRVEFPWNRMFESDIIFKIKE